MAQYKIDQVKLPNGCEVKASPFAFAASVSTVPDNIDERQGQISEIKNRIQRLKEEQDADLLWSAGP